MVDGIVLSDLCFMNQSWVYLRGDYARLSAPEKFQRVIATRVILLRVGGGRTGVLFSVHWPSSEEVEI